VCSLHQWTAFWNLWKRSSSRSATKCKPASVRTALMRLLLLFFALNCDSYCVTVSSVLNAWVGMRWTGSTALNTSPSTCKKCKVGLVWSEWLIYLSHSTATTIAWLHWLHLCIEYVFVFSGVKLSSILTELDIRHIDIWVLVSWLIFVIFFHCLWWKFDMIVWTIKILICFNIIILLLSVCPGRGRSWGNATTVSFPRIYHHCVLSFSMSHYCTALY